MGDRGPVSLGALPLPAAPGEFVPTQRAAHGIGALPVDEEAALHVAQLPALRCNPVDRRIVAQALLDGLVVLTPDDSIGGDPVRTLW